MQPEQQPFPFLVYVHFIVMALDGKVSVGKEMSDKSRIDTHTLAHTRSNSIINISAML